MATEYVTDEQVVEQALSPAGLKVLDIGCGAGRMVRALRGMGAMPTGVECSPTQLAAARAADPGHEPDYHDGVGQDLPFTDSVFDAAIFIYSLHHVPADAMVAALGEAARVVRSGGHVYVAEPVAAGPGHEVDRLIDDETEVRAQAQSALKAASSTGLTLVARGQYLSSYGYPDVDAYLAEMVGVDAQRRATCDRNAVAIAEAFGHNARKADGGYHFDQNVITWLFRKP